MSCRFPEFVITNQIRKTIKSKGTCKISSIYTKSKSIQTEIDIYLTKQKKKTVALSLKANVQKMFGRNLITKQRKVNIRELLTKPYLTTTKRNLKMVYYKGKMKRQLRQNGIKLLYPVPATEAICVYR
jgi:hypothetical protein